MSSSNAAPTATQEQLVEQATILLDKLRVQLEAEVPQLKQAMATVNNYLREFPDLVHILTDEQIAPLYQAMMTEAKVQLAPAKKSSSSKKTATFDGGDLFGG